MRRGFQPQVIVTELSYPADQVRRYDHDRFLTVVFAPAAIREHLFALYAFNIEIAKTAEVVTEPLIGQMRLQWWRDVLERIYDGGTVQHQVALPLADAIRSALLPRAAFDRLIDAREFDLERTPPADVAAMLAYAEGTAAPLVELALTVVAPPRLDRGLLTEPARRLGTAWALTGLLRAVPFHASQRRLHLPADRLTAAGIAPGRLFAGEFPAGLDEVVKEIGQRASGLLDSLPACTQLLPRRSRSPLLLATLARTYLADLQRQSWNPFDTPPQHPLMVLRLGLAALKGRA